MPKTPEQRRAYYLAHREEILAKRAAYRIANREAIRLKSAADYHVHRDEALATKARYYVSHRDEILARRKAQRKTISVYEKAYYGKNHAERLALAARWRREHPEERAAQYRLRRARKRNAPVADFTPAQWQAMLEHYHYRCQYCPPDCVQCKKQSHKLTQDHLTPLSKGGSHTLTNIVPCCKSCNSRKYTGPVLVPVQPLLL